MTEKLAPAVELEISLKDVVARPRGKSRFKRNQHLGDSEIPDPRVRIKYYYKNSTICEATTELVIDKRNHTFTRSLILENANDIDVIIISVEDLDNKVIENEAQAEDEEVTIKDKYVIGVVKTTIDVLRSTPSMLDLKLQSRIENMDNVGWVIINTYPVDQTLEFDLEASDFDSIWSQKDDPFFIINRMDSSQTVPIYQSNILATSKPIWHNILIPFRKLLSSNASVHNQPLEIVFFDYEQSGDEVEIGRARMIARELIENKPNRHNIHLASKKKKAKVTGSILLSNSKRHEYLPFQFAARSQQFADPPRSSSSGPHLSSIQPISTAQSSTPVHIPLLNAKSNELEKPVDFERSPSPSNTSQHSATSPRHLGPSNSNINLGVSSSGSVDSVTMSSPQSTQQSLNQLPNQEANFFNPQLSNSGINRTYSMADAISDGPLNFPQVSFQSNPSGFKMPNNFGLALNNAPNSSLSQIQNPQSAYTSANGTLHHIPSSSTSMNNSPSIPAKKQKKFNVRKLAGIAGRTMGSTVSSVGKPLSFIAKPVTNTVGNVVKKANTKIKEKVRKLDEYDRLYNKSKGGIVSYFESHTGAKATFLDEHFSEIIFIGIPLLLLLLCLLFPRFMFDLAAALTFAVLLFIWSSTSSVNT